MENFDDHVQVMLKSLAGMNHSELKNMLSFIISIRKVNSEDKNEDILDQIKETEGFTPGSRLHDCFDVIQAEKALRKISR